MPERIETDVCVVGAGYAGLTTARRLAQHGKSVVVLEARDRVGGRIWTQQLADGTPIDRGGAWIGPKHDAISGLAARSTSPPTRPTCKGAHLLMDGEKTHRYTGLIPKISPLAIGTLALAQFKIDRMAKHVPIDAPWTAKRAAEWDSTTVAVVARHVRHPHADRSRPLRDGGPRIVHRRPRRHVAAQPADARAGTAASTTLFSIEGGAQENMVNGGAARSPRKVADELGDTIHVGAPVRSITQTDDHVVVESDAVSVEAGHVVVTCRPALVPGIAFDPALPDDRATLYRKTVAGPESKTLVVYDEPFWRADGFSGQTSSPHSACEVTIDASPSAGTPGVIASFTFGAVAEKIDAIDPAERRAAVLAELTTRLGPTRGESGRLRRDRVVERGVDQGLLHGALSARRAHEVRPAAAASPSVACTGPAPRRRPFRTARWTEQSAPANAPPTRSSNWTN